MVAGEPYKNTEVVCIIHYRDIPELRTWMPSTSKALAQTAVKFRPPDGPASKASAMPNVVRQRVVCFAPLRMVAGEPYKNTEIVSIQKSLLFSFHGVSPQGCNELKNIDAINKQKHWLR